MGAARCPMTNEDRARQGRPGLYTYSGRPGDYFDGRSDDDDDDDDDDDCDDDDSGKKKKKKKKKKKRRLLRQMERGVENGESSGEGRKIQRRLFNSRDKFVYERTESDMDENDDEGMEEGRVGLLGRMLGKKKKKKKKNHPLTCI